MEKDNESNIVQPRAERIIVTKFVTTNHNLA